MPGERLGYRAEIDGLRAVAVLAVLFYHAHLGIPGGFVGVDVFFVISGFLITGLIVKEIDGGRFRLGDFWERRVRRIFPIMLLVIGCCLVAGWFLFLPREFAKLGQCAVAQSVVSSNIYLWRTLNYFSQDTATQPLLHTWSLAVEEQFYLLFPFVLVALCRISRRRLHLFIGILCLLSLALSVWGLAHHRSADFYLLPTRAWELMIGAYLAVAPARRVAPRWLGEAAGYAGLGAIVYACLVYNQLTPFPGLAALAPCLGAAALIWSNGAGLTSLGRILAVGPVRFVGLISYSLYLWHWPLLVFVNYWALEPPSRGERIGLLAASGVLAAITWRYVETPFRKRRMLASRPAIFRFALAGTAAVFVVGFGILHFNGIPSRFPAEAIRFADAAHETPFDTDVSLADAQAGKLVQLGAAGPGAPVGLLVWGDSHAMATLPVVDAMCREYGIRGEAATYAASAPLVDHTNQAVYSLGDQSRAFADAIVAHVRRARIPNVVLVAYWKTYIDSAESPDALRHSLIETVQRLNAAGAKVWIMRDIPSYPANVPRALSLAVMRGADPARLRARLADYREDSVPQDRLFAAIEPLHANAALLDPTDAFFRGGDRFAVEDDGEALYSDQHHLTAAGAMRLRPMLRPLFESIRRGGAPEGHAAEPVVKAEAPAG